MDTRCPSNELQLINLVAHPGLERQLQTRKSWASSNLGLWLAGWLAGWLLSYGKAGGVAGRSGGGLLVEFWAERGLGLPVAAAAWRILRIVLGA